MMIESIKKIIKNYLNNEDLVNLQYATVVSVQPLQIQIEKLVIPESKIIIPSWFSSVNIQIQNNDKLLVIRQQGGQLFFVFDKL